MQRGTTTAGVSNKTQFLGNVCSGKWVSTQNRTFRGNDLNVTFLCCDIDSLHLKFSMWLVVAEILQQCKEHCYTHFTKDVRNTVILTNCFERMTVALLLKHIETVFNAQAFIGCNYGSKLDSIALLGCGLSGTESLGR